MPKTYEVRNYVYDEYFEETDYYVVVRFTHKDAAIAEMITRQECEGGDHQVWKVKHSQKKVAG